MIRSLEGALSKFTAGKSPESFFAKVAPNSYQYPQNTIRIIDRNGVRMKVDISDYPGHYLYFGFKDVSLNKLLALCEKGDNVIDVGANIGLTILHLAKISNPGSIFAFEPDPYNFNKCSENLALNDFTNIRLFPVGLSDVHAQLMMEVREPSNRGANRISNDPNGQKIDVVTLDDFDGVKGLDHVDLIKIDVEGYELNVLKGATGLLDRYHPVLFIELDDDNLKDQGYSAKQLVSFLNNNGYRSIISADDGHTVSASDDFHRCHYDIIAR